jgi:hypothetical protein
MWSNKRMSQRWSLVSRVCILFCLAAAGLSLASCRQQSAPASGETAYNRLPSASEVFDLRSKCAALGEKLLAENAVGSALDQDQVSRYSPETNHCYVKIEVYSSVLTTPPDSFVTRKYLYDGQTGELLATTAKKGSVESANVLSEALKKFVQDPIQPSFEETNVLIDKFVSEERKP